MVVDGGVGARARGAGDRPRCGHTGAKSEWAPVAARLSSGSGGGSVARPCQLQWAVVERHRRRQGGVVEVRAVRRHVGGGATVHDGVGCGGGEWAW